jgi:hypothetical protein
VSQAVAKIVNHLDEKYLIACKIVLEESGGKM